MLIKQLDNWVRRAVQGESQAEIVERRSSQHRQLKERRQESRFGLEAKDRRSEVDRRAAQPQANAINQVLAGL